MTTFQPDVTFVIAAFNAERFLHRAVESALTQTGVRVEVVVVDDNSSDGTRAIAESFVGKAVRVIPLAENKGPGGARNAGLAEARGRWIAILDADDTVMPGRMARMIGLGEMRGAEIVVDNITTVSDDGVSTGPMFQRERLAELGSLDLTSYIDGNGIFSSAFNFGYMKPIFKRRFVESHGLRYEEGLRIGEDYIFMASVLASGGRCAVDPEVGYVYHVRKGSVSRVLERQHVAAMQQADAAFACRHDLDVRAHKALRARARNLRQAASFLALVEHLKNRDVLKAFGVALRDPVAVRHLRMPLGKRIGRLSAALAFRTQRSATKVAAPGANGESI